MASTSKRKIVTILALVSLCVICFVGVLVSAGRKTNTVDAVSITQEEARLENVDSLRYGYNVTAGRPLCDDGLVTSAPILRPLDEGLYQYISKHENNGKTEAGNYIAYSAYSIAKETGMLLSGGLNTNISFLSLDVGTAFDRNTSVTQTYSERFETYFQRINRMYYIIQDTVDLREYLSPFFLTDLLNISSNDDAMIMFNKYGTHLFTGFQYGGLMLVTNYMKTASSKVNLKQATSLSTKMNVAFAGYGAGANFSFSEQYAQEEAQSYGTSNYKLTMYGGESVTAVTLDQLFTYNESMLDGKGNYIYDRWVTSINEGTRMSIIGTPASSRAIPLWDLLPDGGQYNVIKSTLIRAYSELCGDKYAEFMQKYPTSKRTIGQTESSKIYNVHGYSMEYDNGNTTYCLDENNTGKYSVFKNSTITFNYYDEIPVGQKEWRVIEGKEYAEVIDKVAGVFKVKESVSNGNKFTVALYNTNNPETNKDDELLYNREFSVGKSKFSGGDGTKENPYLISTPEDFAEVVRAGSDDLWGKYYKLTADIDFKGIDPDEINISNGIGESSNPFSGVFDGNNCTISNFTISEPRGACLGLFGYNSGTIQNLRISNVTISYESDSYVQFVGALCGYNSGKIVNCITETPTINVKNTSSQKELYAGGLVGYSSQQSGDKACEITKSGVKAVSVKTTISSTTGNKIQSFTGGFIGGATKTTIEDSYVKNANKIRGETTNTNFTIGVGGFIAFSLANNTISHCISDYVPDLYATPAVTNSPSWTGTFVGNTDAESTFTDCYVKDFGSNGIVGNDERISVVSGGKITKKTNLTITACNALSKETWESGTPDDLFPRLKCQNFSDNSALTVNTENAKTEFYYGERFSIAGVTVEGHYATDDSEAIPIDVFTFSVKAKGYPNWEYLKNSESEEESENPQEGDGENGSSGATDGGSENEIFKKYTVTIRAMGHKTSYEVSVRRLRVVALKVEPKDSGIKFFEGDEISEDSFTVKYILENGDEIDVPSKDEDYLGYVDYPTGKITFVKDEYVLGDNKVVVTCSYPGENNEVRGEIIVEGIEKIITSLEIKSFPVRMSYVEGQEFDPTGLEIEAKYEAGDPEILPQNKIEIIGKKLSAGTTEIMFAGDNYVTVKLEGLEVTAPYTVTFVDYNGEEISSKNYSEGDVITVPADPVRASDETYSYTFSGWDKPVSSNATESVTYKATYTATYIDYTVTFVDWDNSVISTASYHYGDEIDVPTNPEREADNTYTYAFSGWDKTVLPTVTGNVTYKATYAPTYIDYIVTFLDWDNSVISADSYHYNSRISAPANPVRSADETYTYEFAGWDNEVALKVTENVTYKATYTPTYIEYTVTFINWDSTVISVKNDYHYGDLVTVPETPTRSANNTYTYEFSDWDKEIAHSVVGNAVYKAVYAATYIEYTVIFLNWDNSVLSNVNYHYGARIIAPTNPTKSADKVYTYEFSGWDKDGDSEVDAVSVTASESVTYKAVYTSIFNIYTVTFLNWDNTVVNVATYHYGEDVVIPENPTKASDGSYSYEFSGWDKPVMPTATENVTYKANFTPNAITGTVYTVTFLDWNNSLISSTAYRQNAAVVLPVNPVRAADNTYTYEFSGWDKEIAQIVTQNITYKATYTTTYIDYAVTFVDWNNTVIISSTYHYGDSVIAPANPVRAADNTYTYEFSGWDKPVSATATENVTYKATYTATYIEYVVTFIDWDNLSISTESYHYHSKINVPANPVRAADNTYVYSFSGWDKAVSPTATENVTYRATYSTTYVCYTVTFVDWDNTVITRKSDYHYGDTISVPANPVRSADNTYSYEFSGWNMPMSATATENVTYKATYTKTYIAYTVTFLNWDNSIISVKNDYHYGDLIIIPETPVRTANNTYTYEFSGWDKAVSATVTADATYQAIYTATYIDYTVTFVDWNNVIISTARYHYGDTVTVPVNPVKAADNTYAYAFAGWDKDGDNEVDAVSIGATENVTYKAIYTATYIDYTVTFVDWDNSIITTASYHYNDEISIPENPVRAADNTNTYTFSGWDKSVSPKVTESVTYKATYAVTPIEYIVTFLDWDNSIISTASYRYGDSISVPASPEKSADNTYTYAFGGWDKPLSATVTASVTYKAFYTAAYIEYTVTFIDWDNSIISTVSYHYSDELNVPETPVKSADNTYTYEFNGWDKTVSATVTENATYKATYTATYIEYTVTFVDWNNTNISTANYHYNAEIVVPSIPVRDADNTYIYAFNGWNKPVSPLATENVTYKATYSATYIEYLITFVDWDNSIISAESYHYNSTINVPNTPVRPADDTYSYEFSGWDTEIALTATENVTYKATYTSHVLTDKVISIVFLDWDNRTISSTAYRQNATIVIPERPVRAADNTYSYTFSGWDKPVSATATEDATYKATYKETYVEYIVTFVDWNNSTISAKSYHYNEQVEIPQKLVRAADNTYTYTFSGWNKTVSPKATENATYKAVYNSAYINYSVIFKNWNNEIISSKSYHYGATIVVPANPTRENDSEYSYTFAGWGDDVPATCKGNQTFTAQYTKTSLNGGEEQPKEEQQQQGGCGGVISESGWILSLIPLFAAAVIVAVKKAKRSGK